MPFWILLYSEDMSDLSFFICVSFWRRPQLIDKTSPIGKWLWLLNFRLNSTLLIGQFLPDFSWFTAFISGVNELGVKTNGSPYGHPLWSMGPNVTGEITKEIIWNKIKKGNGERTGEQGPHFLAPSQSVSTEVLFVPSPSSLSSSWSSL